MQFWIICRENFIELHIYFDHLKVHDVKQVPVYASSKDLLGKYSGDNHLKNLSDCMNITILNAFRPLRVCELTLYNLKFQECNFTEAVLT